MFQFSQWGNCFYVERGKCPPDGFRDNVGIFQTSKKARVYHLSSPDACNRHRIGKAFDHQFLFDQRTLNQTLINLSSSLKETEVWWNSYPKW